MAGPLYPPPRSISTRYCAERAGSRAGNGLHALEIIGAIEDLLAEIPSC